MADNTPKGMSSRLATMKFMQRSAAKSSASSPLTPKGPSSKKLRLSNGRSTPSTPGISDREILDRAAEAEDKKRQEALEIATRHTDETKWVLSFQDPLDSKRNEYLNIRQAGFAEIDAGINSEDEEEEERMRPVRMQFGGGVKRKTAAKPVVFEQIERSNEETSSSSEEYVSDDPVAELIRETKRQIAAERLEVRKTQSKLSETTTRRPSRIYDEDMNLGGLTSLSGNDRSIGRESRNMTKVECYNCGQQGHMRDECPNPKAPRGFRGRGRSRGNR